MVEVETFSSSTGLHRLPRPAFCGPLANAFAPTNFPVMDRFLIEVPHEGTSAACARAAELLMRTGSHFITRADFGCSDKVHKAWMIVEADSKEEARNVVPAELRPIANIVRLNHFTMAQVDEMKRRHD
jgi:hypothetical protein